MEPTVVAEVTIILESNGNVVCRAKGEASPLMLLGMMDIAKDVLINSTKRPASPLALPRLDITGLGPNGHPQG